LYIFVSTWLFCLWVMAYPGVLQMHFSGELFSFILPFRCSYLVNLLLKLKRHRDVTS
jgi:hypothetical protein